MQQISQLGSKPGLERINGLLQETGNPQLGLNYIHVAGTNGKGSTSLIIADILIKAGYRVGRFSSPHLHSYLERFTVNGQEISEKSFWPLLDGVEKGIASLLRQGGERPTEFEVLTAIAFEYFCNEKVDIAVLEVGMGGTYDSTNVITPLVSVITGVDYDHTAFLGNTLAEIAANKAGIIKPSVPVIVGMMADEPLAVITRQAASLGAPLYRGSEISITRSSAPTLEGQELDIAGKSWRMSNVQYSLRGDYQLKNLALALNTIEIMRTRGYRADESSIRQSLRSLFIPGRVEVVQSDPPVILDAAHNPQGARALADSLDNIFPHRQKILVFGLLDDKARDATIEPWGRSTRAAIITRPQGSRGGAWLQVHNRWQKIFPDIRVEAVENITDAVRKGLAMLSGTDYLVVTGSFYVLDEARRFLVDN
ncbi:MAG: folylpolyglutamate synthase/dihydrofolate synthase family protein [Syntrophomonadaceae bacterium]|nr:folylpolyglutamate synthase/dihydrofolate synthase family protein [Syntrophomonadaceae bacterium]